MNAAVVEAYDRPPHFAEFADQVAGEGEILVEVKAAGLHQIVKSLASGHLAACHGAAQLRTGTAGGRLRQCVAGADHAGSWRAVPGGGQEAVSNRREGRAAE